MDFKKTFNDHPVWKCINELLELLEKIANEFPEYKNVDEMLKLTYSVQYLKKTIATANPYLSGLNILDNIYANLNNCKGQLIAFMQNKALGLAAPITSTDAALSYTHNLIFKNLNGKNVIEIDSTEIYQRLQKSVEVLQQSYQKRFDDFDKKSQELITQLETAKSNLDATEQRVDKYLVNLQTSFNTAESDRLTKFQLQQTNFAAEEQNRISTQLTNFEQLVNVLNKDTKDIILEMNAKRDKAAELLQIITTTGFAGNYSKNADAEKKQANIFRWISVVIFGIISILAIWILFSFQSNGTNWQNALIKILATSLLTGLATYTTRESSKHRKLEHKYRNMELELSSLDAFIETLPQEERNKIKSEITRKLFSEDEDDEKIVTKNESENSITASLLQNAFRIIEDSMKSLTKK